jgi:hypothetical protein
MRKNIKALCLAASGAGRNLHGWLAFAAGVPGLSQRRLWGLPAVKQKENQKWAG